MGRSGMHVVFMKFEYKKETKFEGAKHGLCNAWDTLVTRPSAHLLLSSPQPRRYRVPCVTLFVSPHGQASYWRIEVLKERTAGVWKP